MIKNLLILPDGTEVSSGVGVANAIKTHTLTSCVNDADELSLGSVCANAMEATLFSPGANLSLTAGDEVTLYKVDDAGNRVKKGIFILENPTRPTANTMKLVGYDRIIKLEKDITEWLKGLTEWPYTLSAFAGMICKECGLNLVASEIPNGDFLVHQFTKPGVTGRKLMKWIGEICCRFCRANTDGEIELAWYTPSGVSLKPTGDRYFFQNGLTYETYKVAPVEAVQIRLAESDSGALWPEKDSALNSYIITGNAILLARVTEELLPHLQTIEAELAGVAYTPCKVSLPANLDIDAGSIVDITDKNGAQITAYVMTKTTTGQRDILECTGSPRRDSATASNNKSAAEKTAEMENVASNAAKSAVDKQTQEDIFNKLTDNGRLQGLYIQDGKLYINAEFVEIVNLVVQALKAVEETADGFKGIIQTDKGRMRVFSDDGNEVREVMNLGAEYLPVNPATNWASILLNEYSEGVLRATLYLAAKSLAMQSKTGQMGSFRAYVNEINGLVDVYLDSLHPSESGNCKWEYIESLGKKVLCYQDAVTNPASEENTVTET